MSRTTMIITGIAATVTLCLVAGLAVSGGIVSGAVCMPPTATSTSTSTSMAPVEQPASRWDSEQIDNATPSSPSASSAAYHHADG
jgi:hypothetical protein